MGEKKQRVFMYYCCVFGKIYLVLARTYFRFSFAATAVVFLVC